MSRIAFDQFLGRGTRHQFNEPLDADTGMPICRQYPTDAHEKHRERLQIEDEQHEVTNGELSTEYCLASHDKNGARTNALHVAEDGRLVSE